MKMKSFARLLSAGIAFLVSLCAFAPYEGTAAPAGTVVQWGTGQPAPPANTVNSITALDAGNFHNLAILTNGTVLGWGFNSHNQTVPPPGITNAIAVAAGATHSLILKEDGKVVVWGDNSAGQTNVPANFNNVTAVAAGDFHSLALLQNGRVVGWGGNNSGQATPPAELVNGLSVATAVAAYSQHSLAIKRQNNRGQVLGWGNNAYGQLSVPAEVAGLNVLAIATGERHSLALLSDGTVRGWGNNDLGQALPPAGLIGVKAIAAGGSDSMAVRSNGTLVVWGANANGHGAVPVGVSNAVAISVGALHKLALVSQPLRISVAPTNQTILRGSNVTFSVTANGASPLMYQWRKNGTNIDGAINSTYSLFNVQLGDAGEYRVFITAANGAMTNATALLTVTTPPLIAEQPQSQTVNAGATLSFTVGVDGTLPLGFQWRQNGLIINNATSFGYSIVGAQTFHAGNYDVIVTNIYGAVTSAVAVLVVNLPPTIQTHPQSQTVLRGSAVSLSVTATEAIDYAWYKGGALISGANSSVYNINGAVPEDAGIYHVIVSNPYGMAQSSSAILTVLSPAATGTNVVVWGETVVFTGSQYVSLHPPGGLNDAAVLAAGLNHNLAIRTNGTVIGWGDNSVRQSAPPSDLASVAKIAAGARHSMALTAGGAVRAWGDNSFGQIQVPLLPRVIGIAAGANHSLALRENGTVAGWGLNSFGQATTPPGTPALTAIAAGGNFSLGISSARRLVGWGENEYGQARPPTNFSDVVAIAAGAEHGLALRTNGTVLAWGRNSHGQTNVPANLSDVVSIAAGNQHSIALQRNGRVVTWGRSTEGQLDVPASLSAISIAAAGHRSLAIKRNLLVVRTPQPRPGGGWRLLISHVDGSPITPADLTRIEVRVSEALSLELANWPRLPGSISLQNGVAQIEDTRIGLAERFYVALER